MRDTALIINSGSTNTKGYTLTVHSNGSVRVSSSLEARTAQVGLRLTRHLFAALPAARRLGPGSAAPCMKSASFGYALTVRWKGWTSPDVSCPTLGADRALEAAIMAIIDRLDIRSEAPHAISKPTGSPEPPPARDK